MLVNQNKQNVTVTENLDKYFESLWMGYELGLTFIKMLRKKIKHKAKILCCEFIVKLEESN